MGRKPKAADISDERFLLTVLKVFEEEGGWTNTWHLDERMPDFPPKVVIAKAGQLMKRNMLQGCDCGCRGDFELLSEGMSYLRAAGVSRERLIAYSTGRAIPWGERDTDAPSKTPDTERGTDG